MAGIVFLASYPGFTDYDRNMKCNEGRYIWHLWATAKGSRDMKVEFLYDDYRSMKMRRHRLTDIISRNKPKVIVAFGQDVIDVLDINEKIGKCRGSVYEKHFGKHSIFIVPTYDFRGLKKPDRMFAEEKIEKGVYTAFDLAKADKIYRNGWQFPKENFILEPTVEDVEEFAKNAIENDWLLGADLEGTGLDTQIVNIVMHGFAWSENDAICIPELKEGGLNYWSRSDWVRVRKCLNDVYSKCRLMFQNGVGYDVPLIRNRGWNLPLKNFQEDTMILHHCLEGSTTIDTLDYGKIPIKELEGKKDFWVISYDKKEKKHVPAKVNKCWKVRDDDDLVRVSFWNKNRAGQSDQKMYIDCTKDHKFLTYDGRWVEASKLTPGDRLRPGQTSKTSINNKIIHRWVYEEFHQECVDGWDIHHIDGNHYNNNPNNLIKVTKSEHNAFHKDVQYKATQTMMYKARTKREAKCNPEEAYHLYFNVGLSCREVAKELSCPPDLVRSVFMAKGWKMRNKSEANKLRWEKTRNCRVVSVTPLKGNYEIFDMEVEKTHCFSANGVIVHNCLAPESPHNIGFISSIYGKSPYWKSAVLDWKVSIFEKDQIEVRRYNCRDCTALHQIRNNMVEAVEETIAEMPEYGNFWNIYRKSMREARTVVTMENNGILLNKKRLAQWNKDLQRDLEELDKELRGECGLPESFSFTSGDHKAYWLFGTPFDKLSVDKIKKQMEVYDHKVYNYQYECPNCGRKKVKRFYPDLEEVPRNLDMKCSGKGACNSSRIHIRTDKEPTLLKGKSKDSKAYMELKERLEIASIKSLPKLRNFKPSISAKTGKPELGKKSLTKYSIAINKRLDDIENLKRRRASHDEEEKDLIFLRGIIGKLQKFNKLEKLRSSFTTYKTDAKGRVHPHFLVTGTATGRLSSKNPNFQNIPSGEVGKKIRGCFQADKGKELMSIDWENLEVWIGAYLMDDKALQKVLEAGINFHDFNNEVFFGVTKDDPNWGTLRKVAKIIVFARLLYGGSDNGIYNQVITAFPDCGLTLKKFKQAVNNYMDAHPDYVYWCKEVQRIALRKRISVNGFGRVRQLLGDDLKLMRQALNSPVQGTAADVARECMADCQEYIDEKSKTDPRWKEVKLLLQIHDEFVFEYPIEMRQEVCKAMCEIMTKPITINGYTFRLKVDPEVGKYWGNQEGYDYINDIISKEGSKH